MKAKNKSHFMYAVIVALTLSVSAAYIPVIAQKSDIGQVLSNIKLISSSKATAGQKNGSFEIEIIGNGNNTTIILSDTQEIYRGKQSRILIDQLPNGTYEVFTFDSNKQMSSLTITL